MKAVNKNIEELKKQMLPDILEEKIFVWQKQVVSLLAENLALKKRIEVLEEEKKDYEENHLLEMELTNKYQAIAEEEREKRENLGWTVDRLQKRLDATGK